MGHLNFLPIVMVSVTVIMTVTVVIVVGSMGMLRLAGLPLGHTSFSLIDFLLGNVDVSIIGPHGVWSELFTSAISPGFSGNVSNSSTLIVVSNFHRLSVGMVINSEYLSFLQLTLSHAVQDEVRADAQNVITFLTTLFSSVSINALLEQLDLPLATSWVRKRQPPWKRVGNRVQVLKGASFFSAGMLQWIVVAWIALVEHHTIDIRLNYLMLATSGV